MGIRDAYRYAARTATRADGSPIGVTRTRVFRTADGVAHVYVATASGPVTEDDLPFVAAAVEHATPLGFTTVTHAASSRAINVAYSAAAYDSSGLTAAQLESAILRSVAQAITAMPIGGNVLDDGIGRLYLNTLRGAVLTPTDSAGKRLPIIEVVIDTPSNDVVLGLGDVVVLGNVVGVVNLFPASLAGIVPDVAAA
jgi:hypothetical protein